MTKKKLENLFVKTIPRLLKRFCGGCCSGGCSCSCNGAPMDIIDSSIKVGYTEGDLSSVPSEANMGLGCGNPIAIAALQEGETVLDLGSGGGFDCFLARGHVGESGHVIGVDMTPDMIELARKMLRKVDTPMLNLDWEKLNIFL